MSVLRDVLKGVRETILLSNKVEQVNRTAEQALAQTHDLRERMARVETILDIAIRAKPRLPH